METIAIKYSAYAKVLPPQRIRMPRVAWDGAPDKTVEGQEPERWPRLPFVEGSAYGVELIYPYETEAHIVGVGGTIRFDFDYTKEPGGVLTGGEFRAFSPVEASKYNAFNTRLDLQPPPGTIVRSEPHPRYFTDTTGTVPLAMIGHLQNEWYARLLSIIFRAPREGQRHIFRKGEPFAQLLFLPKNMRCEFTPMTNEEATQRRALEESNEVAHADVADKVWLGSILAQQGRIKEARACYEDALTMAPSFAPARQALDQLPQ